MTRVLMLVQHLRPGGIERMTLDLAQALNEQNQSQVHIAALEDSQAQAFGYWPALASYRFPLHFLNKQDGLDWRCIYQLRHLMKDQKIDVLHSHHIGPLLYGRLASLGLSLKHIHTEHDSWHFDSRKARWLTRLALLGRPQLIADADSVSHALQHIDLTPEKVITNGVNCQRFQPKEQRQARHHLRLPRHAFIFGCAGRFVPEKGLDRALNMLAQLPKHAHLAIAGDGPQRKFLQAHCEAINIRDRVHFLGQIEDMPLFYQSLDCFCLPSRKEGLPFAILEAQACGIPVLANNVGAVASLLAPGSHLVDADILKSLVAGATTMMNAAHDPKQLHQFIRRHADFETMCRHYLDCYQGAQT
ncbi:D-inositol-3-phosphate glycosyltransferase [Vibrio stylophorae]|uniref:D-inositol-3-phosphate glycosyltransferase n=1 Tax=Vibrio stylophorae TaxID=659351 RepID=A0ABN8DUN3_9VIBR|nr:glycosyltransferase [Vibrio stylophorae]CAH0534500.1 D-inositol-3-phosphate glycosyltransferase [Vibrio stylophorae]